ncbi:Aste57867_14444 [Aphanomyces stellatus]|uniref:Aste57867_14444 protein n=1 Tax=Aphanomyces stellatus TaxID=120398 RepID=A0A485L0Q7_9STRA|nr:hypothetical protein As57867_014390 [Aphanomyces stellatus]VFT91266.1 Aste57867_14444 [Aphanomyces stellatus]
MRVASLAVVAAFAVSAASADNLRFLQQNTTAPVTTVPVITTTAPVTTTAAVTTTAPVTTTAAVTTTAPVTTTAAVTTTSPVTTTASVTTTAPVTTASQTTQTPSTTQSQVTSPPSSTAAPILSPDAVTDAPSAATTKKPATTSKPTTTDAAAASTTSEGMSTGTYVGIGVGAVAGVGLIGGAIFMMLKRNQSDDDDPMSPNDFKDYGNSSLYGAPPAKTAPANPVKVMEPEMLNHYPTATTVATNQRPSPSPVPILAAPAVEYHNIQANNSIMNTFRSAQEDYDRPSMASNDDSFGQNAWTSAMHHHEEEDHHHEVNIDDFETSSYNSSNKLAFNDDGMDSQSDMSRGSSFNTRDSFQSHMTSEMDHHDQDFGSHKESVNERGSYEL